MRCAAELLDAGGHGSNEATLTKVADTLRAAALDEELREQVSQGRVVREQRAAGLGPLASLPAQPAGKGKKKASKPKPEPPQPDPKEVSKAERAVETARRRVEEARGKLDSAQAELAAAERRLGELR